MDTLLTLALCYIGIGALACSSPRCMSVDGEEHTPLGQWRVFQDTFRAVLLWPMSLWREFGPG